MGTSSAAAFHQAAGLQQTGASKRLDDRDIMELILGSWLVVVLLLKSGYVMGSG